MKTLSYFVVLLFLLFFLLAGMFSAVKAQNWTVGDKVAIGHSWTVGNRASNDFEYAFHPSVQVGRSAFYNFNSNVGLGFGTYFSTEGGTFKVKNTTGVDKAEQRMNYVRVPLGFMFTFGDKANKVRPRIGLGGSVGFLVGGKTFALSDDDAFVGAKTTKVMSTKVDAGATASLGFSIKLAEGVSINHDLNYYHGFVENEYDDINLPSFTHRNLSLSMGFSVDGNAMKHFCKKMKSKRQH